MVKVAEFDDVEVFDGGAVDASVVGVLIVLQKAR